MKLLLTILLLLLSFTTQAASKTAILTWTAPTKNTDGSALTDLDHYVINYGTDKAKMTTVISVPGKTITYTVKALAATIYYFSVSAVNASGIASAPSNIAIKSFRIPGSPILHVVLFISP